jgi:hypothetical protein
MKKTSSTIPEVVESRKPTVVTTTAAIVAPASGIRSSSATSRPSATAYGTPRTSRTAVDTMPAMRLIARLPVT